MCLITMMTTIQTEKDIFRSATSETLPISKENVISVLKKYGGSIEKNSLMDRFSGNHIGSLKGVLSNEDMEASVKIWDILSEIAQLEIEKSTSSAWTMKRNYLLNNIHVSSEIDMDSITESRVVGVLCSLGGKASTQTILRHLRNHITDDKSLDLVFTILEKISSITNIEQTSVIWKLKD